MINAIKYRYPFLQHRVGVRPVSKTNRLQLPIKGKETLNSNFPVHGSYGHLLFDDRWRVKRNIILQRDKNQCIICFDTQELQVHHRQYHFIAAVNQFKPPWEYDDHLLITLCKNCHQRGHSKFKVPTLSI